MYLISDTRPFLVLVRVSLESLMVSIYATLLR